jgi:two-component system NarL family sensor kinase
MRVLLTVTYLLLIGPSYSQNLFQKAEEQLNTFDPDALNTIRQLQKKEGNTAQICVLESRYNQNIGNFERALLLARKGLSLASSNSKKEPLKQIMINHYLIGNLDSTIYFGQTYLRQKLSSEERSKALVLVSNSHWSLGNYNYAEDGYKKALKFGKLCNDSLSMSTAQNGLGLIYFQSHRKLSKAIFLFKKAIILTPLSRPLNKANYQLNIAGALIERGEMSTAKNYLSAAELTATEFEDTELLYSCLVNLGNIYLRTNNLIQASSYFKKAEALIKSNKIKQSNGESLYLSLSDLEYKQGNFELSRDYFKLYHTLYDERINNQKNKKILFLQEQFNTVEKKKEIAELKIRNQESELEQKRLDAAYFKAQSLFITSLFLIAILSIFGYWYYRKRKTQLQQKAEKEKRSAILDAVEKEKYRFSRELHDSLGGTLSMSKLMVSQYIDNPNAEKIEDLLQIAIDDTRRISRDLYPSVLKISGLKVALVNLFETLQIANPEVEFDFDMSDFDTDLGDTISLHIYRVCQELTNNTIKYADAKNVVLEIEQEGLMLKLRYRDNGKGINLNTFKTGVGMNSIQERLSTLNGSILINSEPNRGFEANITLPVI